MPPTTRRAATDSYDSNDTDAAAPSTAQAATSTADQATGEAAADTAPAGSGAAGALRQIITVPGTVARQVADDVVTTARRPDAVLYLSGLVGLAVIGVLEWPVAAAAGVGVAVASGVRRARA